MTIYDLLKLTDAKILAIDKSVNRDRPCYACYVCNECTRCINCLNCISCDCCNDCNNCNDCKDCKNCIRCDDCISCDYQSGQKFMVGNRQFTAEIYHHILNLTTRNS